jgi:hypothetical protein
MNKKAFLLLILTGMFLFFVGCVDENIEEGDKLQVFVHHKGAVEPVENAAVSVFDEDGKFLGDGVTSSSGIVSFDLSGGDYFVTATAPGLFNDSDFVSVSSSSITVLKLGLANATVCVENWTCGEWSECVDGMQFKNCTDANECGTSVDKPEEERECEEELECESDDDCDDEDPCTIDSCSGTPKLCSHTDITACTTGDQCCPPGCNSTQDQDCASCSGDDDCYDFDECTTDSCVEGTCQLDRITECINYDNCCPSGCTYEDDRDCEHEDEGYLYYTVVCSNAGEQVNGTLLVYTQEHSEVDIDCSNMTCEVHVYGHSEKEFEGYAAPGEYIELTAEQAGGTLYTGDEGMVYIRTSGRSFTC